MPSHYTSNTIECDIFASEETVPGAWHGPGQVSTQASQVSQVSTQANQVSTQANQVNTQASQTNTPGQPDQPGQHSRQPRQPGQHSRQPGQPGQHSRQPGQPSGGEKSRDFHLHQDPSEARKVETPAFRFPPRSPDLRMPEICRCSI